MSIGERESIFPHIYMSILAIYKKLDICELDLIINSLIRKHRISFASVHVNKWNKYMNNKS